ncbi:unannotated protein [freshwater metagenome]|uniref:Unannotated protein n=1 Tax=freshwater metagenome TaxID=449393 RepID=A0A6J7R1W2_9ZZZZ
MSKLAPMALMVALAGCSFTVNSPVAGTIQASIGAPPADMPNSSAEICSSAANCLRGYEAGRGYVVALVTESKGEDAADILVKGDPESTCNTVLGLLDASHSLAPRPNPEFPNMSEELLKGDWLLGCRGAIADGVAAVTGSAPPTTPAIGGNVLPPVMVEPGATTATAKVGDTIVFKVDGDPANSKIATDNESVLQLTQGSNDGSAQFNPGAKALMAGNATVTVTDAAGKVETVAVTVTG